MTIISLCISLTTFIACAFSPVSQEPISSVDVSHYLRCLPCRVEADVLNHEREKLMKKLIEVEMDGQCAAKQASSLRDLVRKFRQVCGV